MNNILDIGNESCSSCQICSASCPVEAISFSLDDYGFYRPEINENKCVSCGKCKKNCVKFVQNWKDTEETIELFSAINKNKTILADSSSGGIATSLYEYALSNGYKCFGVYYDDDKHIAKGFIIKNKNEIEKARHSKYIPVYAEQVLREIITSNEKWLIIAQPCMLYGLKEALKVNHKNLENFILSDFFCHGVPSQIVWNKQIQELSNKYGKIENVNFRSKNAGWHAFLLSFTSFGKQIYVKNAPFYDLFFCNYMLNSACLDCKVRNMTDVPDIRIGDFWGEKFDLSTEGVSAVICFTKRGKEVLEKVANDFELRQEDFSSLLPYQAVDRHYQVNQKILEKMFSALSLPNGLNKALSIYKASIPLKTRFLLIGKHVAKNLLSPVLLAKVRKLFHKQKELAV